MNLGEQLAAIVNSLTVQFGTDVTILPSQARAEEGQKPFPAKAHIEAPSVQTVQQMRLEGDSNASNAEPYVFTFAGNAGVREGDRVLYKGVNYLLFNAPHQDFQAVSNTIVCIGFRVL